MPEYHSRYVNIGFHRNAFDLGYAPGPDLYANGGRSQYFGFGCVNARDAVKAAQSARNT